MKKRLKIAQIGVRHEHAEGKMATMRTMPDEFEIVGVCAESPADRQGKREQREPSKTPHLPPSPPTAEWYAAVRIPQR